MMLFITYQLIWRLNVTLRMNNKEKNITTHLNNTLTPILQENLKCNKFTLVCIPENYRYQQVLGEAWIQLEIFGSLVLVDCWVCYINPSGALYPALGRLRLIYFLCNFDYCSDEARKILYLKLLRNENYRLFEI